MHELLTGSYATTLSDLFWSCLKPVVKKEGLSDRLVSADQIDRTRGVWQGLVSLGRGSMNSIREFGRR